jgi:hypothetical protein
LRESVQRKRLEPPDSGRPQGGGFSPLPALLRSIAQAPGHGEFGNWVGPHQEVSKVAHPFELSSSPGIAGTKQDFGVEKSEIGISKPETNSKFKSSKTANKEKTFEFGTFGFVSNFRFRASSRASRD